MREFKSFKNAWKSSDHAKTLLGERGVSAILKRLNAKLRANRTEARGVAGAPAEATMKKRGRATSVPNRNNSPLKQAKTYNNRNKMSN